MSYPPPQQPGIPGQPYSPPPYTVKEQPMGEGPYYPPQQPVYPPPQQGGYPAYPPQGYPPQPGYPPPQGEGGYYPPPQQQYPPPENLNQVEVVQEEDKSPGCCEICCCCLAGYCACQMLSDLFCCLCDILGD